MSKPSIGYERSRGCAASTSLLDWRLPWASAQWTQGPEGKPTWRRPKVGSVATQGRLVQRPSTSDSTPDPFQASRACARLASRWPPGPGPHAVTWNVA
jgi:hypothetical protein